ncbi:hypothetical protein [Aquicella lusitana]|uniref:ATP-binding protein n=1 Tax=Aquicella lusitana TaxID=254246 RepID=A0A370G2G7_9COXI|nr:hypothetical protein [Aquicella lusitana]RDI37196.1 hypothetical protein C8D86_1424 [Aquicella lusitana]VVC72562.1 hypothetical protein AQULUS_02740 [Aquicella lusitana]
MDKTQNKSPQSVTADVRANENVIKINDTALLKKEQTKAPKASEDDGKPKPNSTALLLELVKNGDFFHDEQKKPYITIEHDNYVTTLEIDSKSFRDWLANECWKVYGRLANSQIVTDALQIMKGKACFEGRCLPVFTRIGSLNDKIYINLGDQQCHVVEVSASGWVVLNKSPIKFKRTQCMNPLPIPTPGYGDINLLWQHLNVPERQRPLVLAWLIDCFITNTPFPILVLMGRQGSGKSKAQDKLRHLVDPSVENLRNAPKYRDDILTSAANNWLVSFNNVSNLTNDNQDDLCCLSTGGGFSKRRFFNDNDEVVVSIKRPVILNGIDDLVTRQDLLDRSVIISLPEIDPKMRKTDVGLDSAFLKDYPAIFTGLLDALVAVLRILPTVQLSIKPRMADFAHVGAALEKAGIVPVGVFFDEYKKNYSDNMLASLQASSVALVLIDYMKERQSIYSNYAGLLKALDIYRPHRASDWPSSPKDLAATLKRLEPALRFAAIFLRFDSKPKNNGYHVEVFNMNLYKE